ncbi:MAG TPA: MerR family transcriptional regulator [Patescibacteria group bacterium]|nr:MerR family transcriptional regulator [Patescibacteria group bacterium]
MSIEEPILTISVAASLLKLHPRTLMLYERAGLLTPFRTGTKRRLFSFKDLDHLQFIKYLTQNKGMNLVGVKLMLEAISITEKEGINLKRILFPTFKAKKLV